MVVSTAILAVIIGLGALNLRSSHSQAGPKALAEYLSSCLREARQKAVALGQPVAVVFPTDNNGAGLAQSFYTVAGNHSPRMLRAINFSSEYQNAVVFLGHYPNTSTNTAGLALPGANGANLTPANWGLANPNDYAVIFLPSGAVVSDRVSFDQALHLVCCRGANYSSASVSGADSWMLSAVDTPYTITVRATGQIDVSAGLVAESGSVTQGGGGGAVSAAVTLASAGNSSPTISDVYTYPRPVGPVVAGGADATVKKGGYLTLVVEAQDSDGDALTCNWTTSQGTFSSTQAVEMEWVVDPDADGDLSDSVWRAVWEWRPPPGAADNDTFTLTCRVEDNKGGVATDTVGVSGQVQVLPRGRLVFSSNAKGNVDVYTMNADGTDRIRLTDDPAVDERPVWSPNGRDIVFISDRLGSRDLFIMNSDGSDQRRLLKAGDAGATSIEWAAFSLDGDYVAYLGNAGAGQTVGVIATDGGSPEIDIPILPDVALRGLCWVSDDYLVVSGGPRILEGSSYFGSELWQVKVDDGTYVPLIEPSHPSYAVLSTGRNVKPDYHADSNMLVWNGPGGTLRMLQYIPPASADHADKIVGPEIPVSGAPLESPAFSPDGSQIYGLVYSGPNQRDPAIKNADGSVFTLEVTPGENEDDGNWVAR